MGITVFYGTDKVTLGMRNKRLINNSDVNTVMIVPEQFSLSAELNYSDVSKINFEVLSFRRLCKKIFESAGKITGGYVSRSSKVMIMQKVIDESEDKLTVYGKAADKNGFASAIVKTVSEFKHAAITPETLVKKSESCEGYLKDKLVDFAALYSGFNNMLEKTGKDSDDDLTFAYELLKGNPSLYSISGSCILVNYFNGFTMQEKKLIRLFAEVADVYITVLTDSVEDDASLCFSSTVKNIKKLAEYSDVNYVNLESDSKNTVSEILSLNYFKYTDNTFESDDISIHFGKNAFYEVCGVASEIVRLCRDEGYRYRDISVVYRNSDVYCPLIRRCFDMFGIPHFLDYREPASDNPLISFVYAISDVIEYNYSYDSVINLVKSVFSPVSSDDADVFENFVLEYGVFGKYLTDDELWNTKMKNVSSGYETSKILYVRKNIVGPLKIFREKTSGTHTYREHAKSLFELISDYNVFYRLKSLTEETSIRGDLRTAEVYSRIWNVLINILDEIVSVVGECRGSFLKFMSVFKAGLDDTTVGVVPPVVDCVTVSDGQRFVGGAKALFAVGVNNGEFPANAGIGAIFDGSDRDVLSELGIELTANRITTAIAEQEIMYKIFSGAQEKIYLSYRNTNFNGESVAASEVIDRVMSIFPSSVVSEYEALAVSPEYTFENIIAVGDMDNTDYANAYTWFSRQDDWKERLRLLNKGKPSNTVRLSEESVDKLHCNGFEGSISQLETYGRCPFSYFVKYNLRARPRKIFKIGAPDIGTLVHSVLEHGAIEIDKKYGWDNVSREICNDVVRNAVNVVAPEFLNGLMLSSPGYRYTLSKVTKLMAKNLYYIALQFSHSKFRPSGYEIGFGESCSEKPIKLVASNGKTISLTGKIDRCDVLNKDGVDYLRVIDYKTGNKELKLSDVYNGLNLQLLTYLDAVCGADRKPAGILYFRVDDAYIRQNELLDKDILTELKKENYEMRGLVLANGEVLLDMDDELSSIHVKQGDIFKGDVATEQEFEILRCGVKRSIKKLSDGILGGVIDTTPINGVTNGPCVYCDFNNICRTTDGCRRPVKFMNDEEVYEKMREEQNNE